MGSSRFRAQAIDLAQDKERNGARCDSHCRRCGALEQLWKRRNLESPKVCLTRYGEPMISPRAFFELVMEEATKTSASLKDVTWHIFRHTYISRLVMAGVDLRTIQELAGHKDIKMTTRYAHLAPAHKLAAVDRLAEYRKEQEKVEAMRTPGLRLVAT